MVRAVCVTALPQGPSQSMAKVPLKRVALARSVRREAGRRTGWRGRPRPATLDTPRHLREGTILANTSHTLKLKMTNV